MRRVLFGLLITLSGAFFAPAKAATVVLPHEGNWQIVGPPIMFEYATILVGGGAPPIPFPTGGPTAQPPFAQWGFTVTATINVGGGSMQLCYGDCGRFPPPPPPLLLLTGDIFPEVSYGGAMYRSYFQDFLHPENTRIVTGNADDLATIAIDLPDGFSLAPGVPEPSTWAMVLLGFGAMAAVSRSRRARRTQAEVNAAV